MDRDEFWALIHEIRAVAADNEEMAEKLKARLEILAPDQVAAYETHLCACMDQLYTWDVWGAAYVMNGGCSDDGFEYWRAMLISLGKEAFETALNDPDALADINFDDEEANEGEWEFEEFSYIAPEVYTEMTGHEMDVVKQKGPGDDPAGEAWDEETVSAKYPRLAKRFWED